MIAAAPSPRRPLTVVALTLLVLLGAGCVSHTHRIGLGPTGVGSESARQFYLFFGLLTINEVDVQRMAGDLSSYEIDTSYGFVDFLLTPLLLFTVTSRTVTVNK